jgi:hypothetical protein
MACQVQTGPVLTQAFSVAAEYPLGSFLYWFWRGAVTLVKIKVKECEMYELLVIVAGPAGMAAAMYGATPKNMS